MPSTHNKSGKRNLPSLRHLEAAIEFLPEAELWPEDEFTVHLEKYHLDLRFERVKLTNRDGEKTYRWAYSDKVIISR